MTEPWVETVALADLTAADLAVEGCVFADGSYLYRTTGQHLSGGGMGTVHELERRAGGYGPVEAVVGKTFHASYLLQIRTDEVTRRDHHTTLAAITRIAAIDHPNVLPTYVAAPIADNYLFVTPRMGATLLEAVNRERISPRSRVKLLVQALGGLSALHAAGIVHRDVTLRNILLDDGGHLACLFDFDLALSLDDVGPVTYRSHYRGRIFGSPGWSVAPETVDQTLQDAVLSPALDVYAVGSSLHALFTDQLLYGAADDMWALLVRIGEGVVVGGVSKVHYPDEVPVVVRPIIERCLERDPELRYPTVDAIIAALRAALRELPDDVAPARVTRGRDITAATHAGITAATTTTTDGSAAMARAERSIWPWGYAVDRELGMVKGHPIFLASARADLVESGQFPDHNTFPKLVTIIDLTRVADPRGLVEAWQQHYLPILRKVRRAPLTALHKVIYDADTSALLLFSEYIDAPRFGDALADLDLPLDAAAALSFIVVRQIAALHEHGMAHHNIGPRSLLFKGVPDSRAAIPAMIGLVEPAMGVAAMAEDGRALAGLIGTWLQPARVATVPARTKPMLEAMRGKLAAWAFDPKTVPPGIDDLMAITSDALALLDFNFSVLRDAGGDLLEYALLLWSHRTYHLLWPDVAPPA
ncbi:MAG: protein kinase [Kofleriaceae bacterium]